MTEPKSMPKPERTAYDTVLDTETAGAAKKLTVLPPPTQIRESRPVTNLGKVFGQFAELQQQIAEQVVSLEDSVHHQKQDIATAISQLPELRERINWLIASFYEQSKKDETVRDRLGRHETTIETLVESVRKMQATQSHWQTAFDEMIASLMRAKAAMEK